MATPEAGRTPSIKHGARVAAEPRFTVEDVLLAVGEQVGHENISYGSRMNKAVVVFLKEERLVHTLVGVGITLDGGLVCVTPLALPSTRVTVSGVPPFIPNESLESELMRFGKFATGFRHVRLGCTDPRLQHVQSLRRQAFMFLSSPTQTLDVSFKVKYEGAYYTVYASTGSMKCFECGDVGHKRASCPHAHAAPRRGDAESAAPVGDDEPGTQRTADVGAGGGPRTAGGEPSAAGGEPSAAGSEPRTAWSKRLNPENVPRSPGSVLRYASGASPADSTPPPRFANGDVRKSIPTEPIVSDRRESEMQAETRQSAGGIGEARESEGNNAQSSGHVDAVTREENGESREGESQSSSVRPQDETEAELEEDDYDEEEVLQDEEVNCSQLASFLTQKDKSLYTLKEINDFLDLTYGKHTVEVGDYFPDVARFVRSVEVAKHKANLDELSKQKRLRLNKVLTKLRKDNLRGKTVRRLRK